MILRWKLDLRTLVDVSDLQLKADGVSTCLSGLLLESQDLINGFLDIMLDIISIVSYHDQE